MTPNQLHPLELNSSTQEPFLRLRRHKNVIITPMRSTDGPQLVSILNDPLVYPWIYSTKVPYTLGDAEASLKVNKPTFDAVLQELRDAQGSDLLHIASGSPVVFIREVEDDGTDILIGNIAIGRWTHGEVMNTDTVDWEHAEENVAENLRLAIGDPNIIWTIGDYLASSHHGRGIMTDAIETIIHDWAVPRMGCRHIMIGAMAENRGSARVFEKNGFKIVRRIKDFDYSVILGRNRDVDIYEWNLN